MNKINQTSKIQSVPMKTNIYLQDANHNSSSNFRGVMLRKLSVAVRLQKIKSKNAILILKYKR